MFPGMQTAGMNNGLQALDMFGIGQDDQGSGVQDILKLLKQLAGALGIDPQSGEQTGGGCQKAGGGQPASGGQQAGASDAGGVEDLFRKLREMAQQNPQALLQALNQMPGLASALQGAMMGAGGGASGAGMALG